MDVGTLRATLEADVQPFVDGLTRAVDEAKKGAEETQSAMTGIADSVEKATASLPGLTNAAEKLQNTLKALKAEALETAAGFLYAGQAGNELELSLKGAFGDAAGAATRAVENLGAKLGVFTEQQMAGAAKSLQKFGVFSEENLKLAGDLAAKTGKSVEGLAEKWGRMEKFTNARTFLALQRDVGATGDELKKFGAVVDKNNKVLLDTPARIEAAKQAMEAWAKGTASGTMEKMGSETKKLNAEWELFKRHVGEAIVPIQEGIAKGLREALGWAEGLAEALGITSEKAKAAADNIAEFKKLKELGGKTVQQAKDAGFTSENAEEFVNVLKRRQQEAMEQGNDAAVKSLKTQILAAQTLAHQMKAGESAGKEDPSDAERKKADQEAEKRRRQAFLDEKALIETTSANKKEEVDRLKALAESDRANHAEKRELMLQIHRLQEQINKGEEKDAKHLAAEKARAEKEAFDVALDTIKRKAQTRAIDHQQEISELQQLLAAHQNNAHERIRILDEIANAQRAQNAEKKREENKAEADRKKQERLENKEGREILGQRREAASAQREDAESTHVDAARRRREAQSEPEVRKATQDSQAALQAKLAARLKEIELTKEVAVSQAQTAELKAAAEEAAQVRIRAAQAETARDAREDLAEQKRALDELRKKKEEAEKKTDRKAFKGPMSVEEFAQSMQDHTDEDFQKRKKATQDVEAARRAQFAPGRVNVPNPETEAKRLKALDNNFHKAASTIANTQAPGQSPEEKMGAALGKELVKGMGHEMAKALGKQPVAITVNVMDADGSTSSQTFQGPRDTLSKAKNVKNPNVPPLGAGPY